ncbi:MAG TPA: alpha/beta fold hydrolase, partial [Candidatus Eisenbacteria bacterium]|nr:alpha/beta fold hydrolase [Candidatus Eisenbacteria bacterium]
EGLLQDEEGREPGWIAVVCHPHPLYGGTMHNKVAHRVASVLHELGGAVLRFNFRGVGASAGTHDQGVGELEDARAALAWMRDRHPDARRRLAGFSFGSGIAARLAASEPGIERVILIAPPVATTDFSVLRTLAVPKLVIQGTRDAQAPIEALEREYPAWAEPKTLVRIEGATHFFDRQLGALADAVREALA